MCFKKEGKAFDSKKKKEERKSTFYRQFLSSIKHEFLSRRIAGKTPAE